MLVPTGVEEALFKRVSKGWVFSAPNPWTFGRRRSFLVNDAQKADLALRVRRGRYFRLLALIPMFALPLATFLLVPSLLRGPSITMWLLLAAIVLVATVAINLCDYLPVRRALAGLPRTTERITLKEMHGRQAQAMSVKALTTLTLIEVLACAFVLGEWYLSGHGGSFKLVSAAGLACMAILFGGMLLVRLRTPRTVS